jgi:CubicO group peptidase (beta-lactamase class C family)
MRDVLRAFSGVAALALSMAAVAPAQQPQTDPATMTEAQTAGVKRLKETLEVLNTGDYAKIRAYFEAQRDPNGLENALSRYHLTRGYDLMRVEVVPNRGDLVAGIVRNRITGDEEYLGLRIEPQAPHRITLFQARVPDEVAASWKLKLLTSTAVTEKERLQEIGAYLKRTGDADIFSGAVVIARDGKPVFAQAYGYANREKKIPNTVDTPFLLGSINKLFTGLAIGQLVEQGKLSYDDALSKFLPDYPDAESAKKITIKHLLSHTSGIPTGFTGKAYDESLDRQTTVQAILDGSERKLPAFEPGTGWAYSNLGFVLLGRVIEVVTGADYYEHMNKNVFVPAGANTASFPHLPRNGVAVIPMAYPYEIEYADARLHFVNKLGKDFRRGGPSCCSIVSAPDLIKLSYAMRDGRIVKPETFRLHSSAKPELGSPKYGYGFIVGPYLGRPFVGHNGRAAGVCTEFGELRDTPYTIAVLSNVDDFVCRSVTQRILRVLRPTEATQDKPNFVGTWRTDMSRSKTGSGTVGPDQTITVEGSKMTVTQTTAGNSNSNVYVLDGSPSKWGDAVVTSKWDGNVLVTTAASASGERIEKRSMEPDGAMKVELTYHFSKETIAQRPAGAPKSETFYRVYTKIK